MLRSKQSKQSDKPGTSRGKKVMIGVLAVSSLFLTGCTESVQPSQMAVVIDDDLFPTDPTYLDCMQPGTNEFHPFDEVYRYPARQISWDATGDSGAERGPYTVVSSNEAPAELTVPVVVTMDLTTDCETLKKFHSNLGTKYTAWLNDDGTTKEGWVSLLDYVVGQPMSVTLTRVSQQYSWQQIWNDETVRKEFQDQLLAELPNLVRSKSDGNEYFSNFQVTVGKPDLVNDALKQAIADKQSGIAAAEATQATEVAKAAAAKAAADAQIASAEAETKVAQQKALQKQAEIAGYPSVDAYLMAQCISAGCNPYQNTYVVPQQATG